MKWDSLDMKTKAKYINLCVKNGLRDLDNIRNVVNTYEDGGDLYTVKAGDSLWRIAHNNKIDLDDLRKWNPQVKGNMIHPNDRLSISRPKGRMVTEYEDVKTIRERESNNNKDNLSAIQAVKHSNNYVVIDKENANLTVFDTNNNPIYTTNKISTGKNAADYNTITYVGNSGSIISGKGNESTPAGITKVTGTGTYHGVPSFTRGRYNNKTGEYEDIAASLHSGSTASKKSSNGCVRVGNQELCDLDNHLNKDTFIYTLPETEGSRFEIRDGRLNFFADNPYGQTEGDKKYWDDYNVHNDKGYNPLVIVDKMSGNDDYEYEGNKLEYSNSVSNNKQALQKKFNVDSDTYNRIAELAMGIAEQETKFNTSDRKALKDLTPDWALNLVRGNSNRSRGSTQIKLKGDNKEMQEIYKEFGINEDTIENMDVAALATMSRLLHIYNTEVRGRNFNNENETVSPYDALLYKWMGRNAELKNKTATPSKNNYIKNVKKYMDNFEFLSGREREIFD